MQLTGNGIPFVPLGDFGGPKNGKLSRFFVNRRCCSTVFVRNFCIQEFTRVFFDSVSYVSMIRVEGFQKFVRYSLFSPIVAVVDVSSVKAGISRDDNVSF